jgi:hypothetical protein
VTREQAKAFIARYPDAVNYVKPAHLELPDLLEVHIDAIEVRPDEFHKLDGGKTFSPKKETLDKFASAAGVSYNELVDGCIKESENVYVGKSQATVLGPDGNKIYSDVAVYEFDCQVRADEIRLEGKKDWTNVPQGGKPNRVPHTPLELEKELNGLRKVARQRANTGARSRATLSILGMQTGFKDLFKNRAVETFLFSRVIVNTKNQLMAQAMIANLTGNTHALFGPNRTAALEAPVERKLRDVTPPEEDFDPTSDKRSGPPVNPFRYSLQQVLDKYRDNLGPKAISTFEATIANPETTDEVFADYLDKAKTFLAGKGITMQVSGGVQ